MKSIVLEGDLTEAPCESCQRFTQAQFAYGPVELEDGLVVENVMRATCETCGSVVSLAQQSSYLLRQALYRHKRRRTTVRLPQELADFIALKLSLVGMRPSKVDLFFRALLLAARGQERGLGQALSKIEDPVLSQRLGVTVNLSLRPIAQDVIDLLVQHSGLRNSSEVLRRLLVLADAEGLEFGPRVAQVTEELAFTAA
jgi:Arc/MetJ-type ribon-helix-helix transcriptional regulator